MRGNGSEAGPHMQMSLSRSLAFKEIEVWQIVRMSGRHFFFLSPPPPLL